MKKCTIGVASEIDIIYGCFCGIKRNRILPLTMVKSVLGEAKDFSAPEGAPDILKEIFKKGQEKADLISKKHPDILEEHNMSHQEFVLKILKQHFDTFLEKKFLIYIKKLYKKDRVNI